ncbi:MAG: pyridoxal-dependent decarboxylase [Parvularculaceae bacterium]
MTLSTLLKIPPTKSALMNADKKNSDMASPADMRDAFEAALEAAYDFRLDIKTRGPAPSADPKALMAAFDVPFADRPRAAGDVIRDLAAAAAPGLMGNAGPNFYAWVMGASHPAGVAADWLTSAWGQNSGLYATAPAAAVAEEVSMKWLLGLFDLPSDCGFGFTTGATMAGFTCLAAARNEVLSRAGWSIEERGVFGAPEIKVFLGEEAHSTIFAALRYLGFGERNFVRIAIDGEGRMSASDLAARLSEHDGPKIIIAQAGHINSGAFDPFTEIAALSEKHGAWLHIDGAFGLWARATPSLAPLCKGAERADSWSVDGHKWLQIPYDTAFAIVKDATALRRAMAIAASYLNAPPEGRRDPSNYAPELSRRARGFAVWAVLQALGRSGVEEMILRHCDCARRLASRLESEPGVEILNEVVLNQLAIAFAPEKDRETQARLTDEVIAEIQRRNRCYVSGAAWKGKKIMRVSISSGETDFDAIDLLAEETLAAWRKVRERA